MSDEQLPRETKISTVKKVAVQIYRLNAPVLWVNSGWFESCLQKRRPSWWRWERFSIQYDWVTCRLLHYAEDELHTSHLKHEESYYLFVIIKAGSSTKFPTKSNQKINWMNQQVRLTYQGTYNFISWNSLIFPEFYIFFQTHLNKKIFLMASTYYPVCLWAKSTFFRKVGQVKDAH